MVIPAFPPFDLTDRIYWIPFFFPSPSLGSLYTMFNQCSKAMSEEGCAEVHVRRVYYVCQMTMTNQKVSKFEKSLAKVLNLINLVLLSAPDVFAYGTDLSLNPPLYIDVPLAWLIVSDFSDMLQAILRQYSLNFPHTSARLAYWRSLLFYDDTGLLDPRNAVIAILPACIYFLDIFLGGDDVPFEDGTGTLGILSDCIIYGLCVHVIFDTIVALDLLLRAPGFWTKILLAVDLLVESQLVLLASLIVFLFVGLFVSAALEGFPFVVDVFKALWMWIKFDILNFEERIEVDFEDDPFRDE